MSKDQFSAAQSPCSIAPTVPDDDPIHRSTTLTFDPEQYRHFLADCDWTDSQKDEFTEALWAIVLNFVDLGYGLHPVQQVGTLAGESPSVVGSDINSGNITKNANDLAALFAKEGDS